MCDFKKPIIMSTGAASLAEIAEAVSWIEAKGNPLALLHCVLNYPTMDENAALGMIPALVRHFPQHVIGYSDHTLPNDMKVLEVAALDVYKRQVSMHCQKPVWRYMESWPSAARRSSGSFSRSQDSSSER